MTRVAKLREQHRDTFYERTGTKLTFMPFIFEAVNKALRKFPIFNAQVSGDQIIYKQDINLGMAVALDWGLIVPVIKRADDLSISGLARAANDLADRARTKQLKPDEVTGGTFTITNPGVFGGLFGTPIINQPQLAILGVGKIEKRPKVMTVRRRRRLPRHSLDGLFRAEFRSSRDRWRRRRTLSRVRERAIGRGRLFPVDCGELSPTLKQNLHVAVTFSQ